MKTNRQNKNLFLQSCSVFHSVLIIPVILYLADLAGGAGMRLPGSRPLILAVYSGVIMFLSGGFYGAVIEIVCQEQVELKVSRVIRNGKKYWKYVLVVLTVGIPVNFVYYSLYGDRWVAVMPYFDIVVSYCLALLIISDKYLKTHGLARQRTAVRPKQFYALISLFAVNVLLLNAARYASAGYVNLPALLNFLVRCLHVLSFIYIVYLLLEEYPGVYRLFESGRELHLVVPPNGGVSEAIAFPLLCPTNPGAFVVLSALTPANYRVKRYNRITRRQDFYKKDALVAVSCFTSNSYEAYKIAKEYKSRGATVVMGGCHVSHAPGEALEFCDSVVIGEAEGVWPEVVKDYEAGRLKKVYSGMTSENYYQDVHRAMKEIPPGIMKDFLETSRGCKYRCDFCTIPFLNGGRTRTKPVQEVVELLKILKPRYSRVWFVDNNIYSNPAYARELFRALVPLKMKWGAQCSIDVAADVETLKLMKQSGCDELIFGLEIAPFSLQKEKRGKYSLARKYRQYIKRIKKAGIRVVKGQFIFGFEEERWTDVFRLWRYCFQLKCDTAALSFLTPLPGSEFYARMLKENSITNLNWRQYDLRHLVFRHPNMNNTLLKCLIRPMQIFFVMTASRRMFSMISLAAAGLIVWLIL